MIPTSIPFQEMADHLATQGTPLLTLDQAREKLATTEPLQEITFPTSDALHFTVPPGWADGEGDEAETGAILHTPGGEQIMLSKKAVLESGAAVGIPRGLQQRMPSSDLSSLVNWWFQGGAGEKDFKAMVLGAETEQRTALAMCRGTIIPFSNLTLLNIAVERVHARYGESAEVLVDYKLHHDLELTCLRLIIPGDSRVIEGTRVEDDSWSAGLDLINSLIGLRPTDICAYLFRWWCTNGSTNTLASSGQFSRKGSHTLDDVWAWARDAVDASLDQIEGTFEGIQALTDVQVNGDVTFVLRDLFSQYQVPVRERNRIISTMADLGGELTMYDIHAAITQAANLDTLPPRAVGQLLGLGGHVAYAATSRCNECRRLLPDGYITAGHEGHDHAPAEIAAAE